MIYRELQKINTSVSNIIVSDDRSSPQVILQKLA